MLSRWRKGAREGRLRGRVKRVPIDARRVREIQRLQALEREHAMLKAEHELLRKSHPVLVRTKAEIFEFIHGQRGDFSIRRMCTLYGVIRAGDYAWHGRRESARRQQDRRLTARIQALFDRSRGTYGSPRLSLDEKRHHRGVHIDERRGARPAPAQLHAVLQRSAAAFRNRVSFPDRLRDADTMTAAGCLQNRGKIPGRLATLAPGR